jgi:hypothetical protein
MQTKVMSQSGKSLAGGFGPFSDPSREAVPLLRFPPPLRATHGGEGVSFYEFRGGEAEMQE